VVLVEGTDRVHDDASTEVQQRVKIQVQRGELNGDLPPPLLEFHLGEELHSAVNGGSDEKRHALQ